MSTPFASFLQIGLRKDFGKTEAAGDKIGSIRSYKEKGRSETGAAEPYYLTTRLTSFAGT